MGRKYEVHIDGKPLVIADAPDPRELADGWLLMDATAPEEVANAVDRFRHIPGIKGLYLFGRDVEEVWDWFRSGYRFVQAAGGAVGDGDGRLLVIHRLGLWDLPKGKVEEGEAIDVAAVREVQEECGLRDVTLLAPLCVTWHTYERKGREHLKRTDWYTMRADATQPLVAQQEEDITEVRWMDEMERAQMKRATYPSLLAVINAWEAAPPGPGRSAGPPAPSR